jgi:predicted permease
LNIQLLGDLFAVIAPVLITITVGFCWARAGFPFHTEHLTRLITLLGTPCLIVSTILRINPTLEALGVLALIAVILQGIMGVMGTFLLKAMRLPSKPYLPSLIFANNGNMGLSLCLFAFGESGLALAIAYFMTCALGQFTVGQTIASGRRSLSQLLRTPLIWAMALALTLTATDCHLPRWMSNTIHLIGQLTIPLMLLTLGVSLSRLKVTSIRRSVFLAAFRIAVGMALGFLLADLFGLEGEQRGVVLIQASMPAAVFNYLFAQYYQNRPEEVAGIVVLSTAMSFIVLPFLLTTLL